MKRKKDVDTNESIKNYSDNYNYTFGDAKKSYQFAREVGYKE
jgi:hypothetical protein